MKFALHGQISRISGAQANSKFPFSEFASWNVPYTGTFRGFANVNFCNSRLARTVRNVSCADTFRLCDFVSEIARIFALRKIQILNSEFWHIDEIEAELVQQWCSISPTLLNFRNFKNWILTNSNRNWMPRKGELIPPILKNFWPHYV